MLGQQAARWPALPASQLEECSSSRALPLLLDLRTMSEHCSSRGHTLRFPVAGPGEWYKAPWIPLRVLVTVLLVVVFSLLQRKSSKAKEKKQKRLEERAAMDAVCAKVDAANRVTLLFNSSLNFSFFF